MTEQIPNNMERTTRRDEMRSIGMTKAMRCAPQHRHSGPDQENPEVSLDGAHTKTAKPPPTVQQLDKLLQQILRNGNLPQHTSLTLDMQETATQPPRTNSHHLTNPKSQLESRKEPPTIGQGKPLDDPQEFPPAQSR